MSCEVMENAVRMQMNEKKRLDFVCGAYIATA